MKKQLITITIDKNKYRKLVKDTYEDMTFNSFEDNMNFMNGFEQLTDMIDNAIKSTEQVKE